MDATSRLLHQIHARYAPVDARVAEVLDHIRQDCKDLDLKQCNADNERQLEQFIARVEAEFPGRAIVQRQRLSKWAVRTTRWNYLFTVPGESDDQVVLVAHYDTWRGPGADDNTTGEEILKQYLLSDLKAGARPHLTHVYFFAGSEECGLVGLFSQLLLSFGLFAGNFALTYGDWGMLAIAIALLPLASYRFGVSGSREYVRTLSPAALRQIRAVVSIDSVGEGRLYIPRETMGADFIRVLIPFGDYDSLNDLLEEAAHLHGIKYNNFLAGGTTDHVSFLEVNNGLWARAKDGVRRLASAITGRPYAPPPRIPATALVAMRPGKASPIVFGGKIHTPNDTHDHVYPEPLRQTLLILDYLFYRIEGGPRISQPRELDEFHYARLYKSGAGHLVALKDAVEPNRRNLNAVYHASVTRQDGRAVATLGEIVSWGSREPAAARGPGSLRRRRARLPARAGAGPGSEERRDDAALYPASVGAGCPAACLPRGDHPGAGCRAALPLCHLLRPGVRTGECHGVAHGRGIRALAGIRAVGGGPRRHHPDGCHAARGGRPAPPHGAAHSGLDRQYVQARQPGR